MEGSMIKSREDKIEKHHQFWQRKNSDQFLTAVSLAPDFFFSRHFEAAHSMLTPGTVITPDMLDVDAFMDDYERMYQDSLALEHDAFWAAIPFTGIPWMEGILGCTIIAMENSYISEPTGATIDDQPDIIFDPENEWLAKYLEFTEALTALSDNRFPVGEPIMRGPSDMFGSLLGQEAMVYAILLQPERSRELFYQVTDVFKAVIQKQQELIPSFHGGYTFGFYNVWCPERCIWYQEDLSALLSPDLFQQMLRPCGESICEGYDYTAIHLHPSSFFIIDGLLEMDELRVIQITKDVGGPSIAQMMPTLQRVAGQKNLILWGDFDEADLTCAREQLSPEGVCLHLVTSDADRANSLLQLIS